MKAAGSGAGGCWTHRVLHYRGDRGQRTQHSATLCNEGMPVMARSQESEGLLGWRTVEGARGISWEGTGLT